jgi:soluble lytic murein transglycosylase-like protein
LNQVQADQTQDNDIVSLYSFIFPFNNKSSYFGPLTKDDLTHYATAFIHQDHSEWAEADQSLERLSNPILMGYVLSQRYLSRRYQPTADELIKWMENYADHPQAEQIYNLAKSRLIPVSFPNLPIASEKPRYYVSEDFMSSLNSPELQKLPITRTIHAYLRQNKIEQAGIYLTKSEQNHSYPPRVIHQLQTAIAFTAFGSGYNDLALHWAETAVRQEGSKLPEAHWILGLTLWRLGRYEETIPHFEQVATTPKISPWLKSAGAFWAARANLITHHPQIVNRWLKEAATFPQTFYGLLARRSLGNSLEYSWKSTNFSIIDQRVLYQIPGAIRAMALLQLEDHLSAYRELEVLLPSANYSTLSALLALASHNNLPDLALKISNLIEERNYKLNSRTLHSGQFPIPDWRPSEGWSIDRALIYAITKEESGFNPRAVSSGGAVGLMQLIPETARSVGIKSSLKNPSINFEAGQRYIKRLLGDETIKGNLLYLIASYNVGPALVAKWIDSMPHNDDPLIFIETIPYPSTKSYLEHILTNLWLYQSQMNEETPSLEALASGQWPIYSLPLSSKKSKK